MALKRDYISPKSLKRHLKKRVGIQCKSDLRHVSEVKGKNKRELLCKICTHLIEILHILFGKNTQKLGEILNFF
jgi:hypothetical protein